MLEVFAVELLSDSRRIAIEPDNVSQTMKFALQGNFMDEADVRPDLWVQDDDQEVMRFVYQYFPWFREFMRSDGSFGLLFLTAGTIENTSDVNTWIVELTYDVPDSSSSMVGGDQYNSLIEQYQLGPGGGENGGNGWSSEFTQLSFNSTADTRHVNTSLQLMEVDVADAYAATLGVPAGVLDKPCAIGATEDGIEGTDVYDRDFKFQITQYFSPSRLKYRYIRRVHLLTATVNTHTFFGFPAGSVLFLGASGSGTLIENIPVTFEFAVRPNFKLIPGSTVLADPNSDNVATMFDQLSDPGFPATDRNLNLPGGAGVHSGWSTVDYRYLPIADQTAKQKFQKPALRLIHRTQENGDFRKLEL